MLPLAAVAVVVSLAAGAPPADASRTPVLKTPHFAIYSDFDTNLNDALINTGLARRGKKAELFQAGDEAACFGKLTPSARAAWNTAVDYYAKVVSPTNWDSFFF